MDLEDRLEEIERIADRYGIRLPEVSAAEMRDALAVVACALTVGRENQAGGAFYRAIRVLDELAADDDDE